MKKPSDGAEGFCEAIDQLYQNQWGGLHIGGTW